MNQIILTVMKCINNPESVSLEERERNKKEAETTSDTSDAADYAFYCAAYCAARNDPEKAAYWVDEYFKETREDKQEYLNKIKGEESMSEWEDGIPPVGSEVVMPYCDGYLYSNAANESFAIASDEVLIVIAVGRRHNDNLPVVTVMAKGHGLPGYATVNPHYLTPAKTQKQKDREAFIEKVEGLADDAEVFIPRDIAGMMFDSGFTAPEGGSNE